MEHAQLSQGLLLFVALAPLAGAILAGFFGKTLGRANSHRITILGVALSFFASAYVFKQVVTEGAGFNGTIYEWMKVGGITMEVGFLVDSLTAMMMCVVTFVSLMVHIYTIGYMEEDDGYQRFFAYISLFTFSMLMLVMSNNLLQLFFGWEAVGLVSYLLIGFWFKKETAVFANLKAFLVNRVGDFGFILGIGLLVYATGSLNYSEIFAQKDKLAALIFPGTEWMLLTVACLCLFVGAMGKSAQFPLHVWLPDSMEGPTPISALIHAATMVTAGIFMVSRMSPLFELSDTALSVMMVIGAITALFMGFLGVIQNDIKRVVAYSTLSQLGYMTVALGASAYPVALFHLMTHAFFKALLFLGAGSVIMGMHHNQDMRYMGGLRKYMPITWITSLLGSLALIGLPFLSGFYSKDSIIEAVHLSNLPGAGFASFAVTASVFVTALYSFRMYFLVFHGEERYDQVPHDEHHDDHSHGHGHAAKPHESPWVVTLPLVLLAIPSVLIGFFSISGMLYGDFFKGVITIDAVRHPALATLAEEFHGPAAMAMHSVQTLPFWLMVAGVAVAYWFYMLQPAIPKAIYNNFRWLHTLLENKYYLDAFNEKVLAAGARGIGRAFWKGGDATVIDGFLVNGSARTVGLFSVLARHAQNGRLYRYAWVMSLAVLVLLTWQLWPYL